MSEFLLENGNIVTESEVFRGDILIKDDRIEKIMREKDKDSNLSRQEDVKTIDLQGKYVLPGIIDAHTHYFMESRDAATADNFTTGSRSALMGGVTTFIDYVVQTDRGDILADADNTIKEISNDSYIDFSLHQCIYNYDNSVKNQLSDLKQRCGISNLKIFTTYKQEGFMFPPDKLKSLFKKTSEEELLITVHAEDHELIKDIEKVYVKHDLLKPFFHSKIRPSEAESMAIEKLGKLSKQMDLPLYIAHLSSRQGAKVKKELNIEGARITAETTPHHLLLDHSYLTGKNGNLFFMTPPLRSRHNSQYLWQEVKEGNISVIATDHCSYNKQQKFRTNNCLEILPGIPGTETLLPLIHDYLINQEDKNYTDLMKLLSTNPAKIFGLYPQKGSLIEGTDADITILNPDKTVKINEQKLNSAADYTPYEGFEVKGYPEMVFSRGELIMNEQNLQDNIEPGRGEFISADTSSLFFD